MSTTNTETFIHSCTQDLAQRRHLAGIKQMLLKITSPYGDENRHEKRTLSGEPHKLFLVYRMRRLSL